MLVHFALPAAAVTLGGGEPGVRSLPASTADHNVGNVTLTVTDVGAYGYVDPNTGLPVGSGFSLLGLPSALYHAGLMCGISATQVSDAAYGSDDNGVTTNFNFTSTAIIQVGSSATIDQYTCSSYADLDADTSPIPVVVDQSTYAWAGDQYVIIDVFVNAPVGVSGLFVAIYADWDIGTFNANHVDYDAARQLGHMRDQSLADPNYYGIQLLSSPASGYRAVYNPTFVYPGVGDPGFEDADKFSFFTGFGTVSSGPIQDDWSHMITAGPFDVSAGNSTRVAFAMLAGTSLGDLQSQADQAQARWDAGIVSPCLGPISIESTTWGKIKAIYR
jgi:hypothetical protein